MVEPVNTGFEGPTLARLRSDPAPDQYGPITPEDTLILAKPWGAYPDGSYGYWPTPPVVNR